MVESWVIAVMFLIIGLVLEWVRQDYYKEKQRELDIKKYLKNKSTSDTI